MVATLSGNELRAVLGPELDDAADAFVTAASRWWEDRQVERPLRLEQLRAQATAAAERAAEEKRKAGELIAAAVSVALTAATSSAAVAASKTRGTKLMDRMKEIRSVVGQQIHSNTESSGFCARTMSAAALAFSADEPLLTSVHRD